MEKIKIDLGLLVEKTKREIVYLKEMREGLIIQTKDMLIVGTGDKEKATSQPTKVNEVTTITN